MKNPKVPQGGPHIAYACALSLVVIVLFYFINRKLQVSDDTRRFIVRAGAVLLVNGATLGVFGISWGAKNRQKLRNAQREIVTCTEAGEALTARNNPSVFAEELRKYDERKKVAKVDLDEASNFDDTVAKVSLAAVGFLVVGTIIQAIAA